MQHHFDVELAERYGILEAILLNHFQFWFAKNKANGQGFKDGRYWTYNSVKAFNELFPYVTEKKIRTALKHLIDEGVLMTGNYNQSTYDRTLWYAFTDYGKSICPFGKMEIAEKENGSVQKGEPIPNNNTDNNAYDNTDNRDGVDKRFKDFVSAYPKPVNEYELYRIWISLSMTDELFAEIMKGLDKWKQSEQWRKNNGQYIANALVWLREKRWRFNPPKEDKKPTANTLHRANYDTDAYRAKAQDPSNYQYKKK